MKLISTAYRLLPRPFRNLVMYNLSKAAYTELYKHLPQQRIFLDEKHIENCRFLSHRVSLLKHLPSNGVIAEIGVFNGDFTSEILEHSKPLKLYLVDDWRKKRSRKESLEKRFAAQIEKGILQFAQLSHEGLLQFEENSLDWVYVDTESKYPGLKEELELMRKKVKSNGLICGNKYITGQWKKWMKYDTIESVNAFCVEFDYELIYFVQAPGMQYSFALRKMEVCK